MRRTRPIPQRSAAAAGVAAFAALVALAGGSVPAGAATTPNAQSEYKAAIKAAGSQGVHFSSAAAQSGVTIQVDGDTGATSGAQVLTVKRGTVTERMAAMVVGSTGYVKGNEAALHSVIGLTSAQSRKYANTWLSFPTSNSGLAELVNGLLNSQIAGELEIDGPYSFGTRSTVDGQQALAVRGSVSTESGSKVPVLLYVPTAGTPTPIEEVTNPGSSGGSSAIHGTVSFSHWGEKTTETAPGSSVSLLKLVPSASSGATSTTAG